MPDTDWKKQQRQNGIDAAKRHTDTDTTTTTTTTGKSAHGRNKGGGSKNEKKNPHPCTEPLAPNAETSSFLIGHTADSPRRSTHLFSAVSFFSFFLFSFLPLLLPPPPQRSRAACLDSPPDIFSRGAYLCLCFVSYLSHQTDERLPEMLSTPATARRRCPTTHCTSQKHISVLSGSSPFHQSPASGPLAPSPLGPANTVARGAQTDPPPLSLPAPAPSSTPLASPVVDQNAPALNAAGTVHRARAPHRPVPTGCRKRKVLSG